MSIKKRTLSDYHWYTANPNYLDSSILYLVSFRFMIQFWKKKNRRERNFRFAYLVSFWRWDSRGLKRTGWSWSELCRPRRRACSCESTFCRPAGTDICFRSRAADPCFSACQTFRCNGFYPFANRNRINFRWTSHSSIVQSMRDLRGVWVVFGPYLYELVQMVSTQDRRISGQIVEIIHNDGNEQVQHLFVEMSGKKKHTK